MLCLRRSAFWETILDLNASYSCLSWLLFSSPPPLAGHSTTLIALLASDAESEATRDHFSPASLTPNLEQATSSGLPECRWLGPLLAGQISGWAYLFLKSCVFCSMVSCSTKTILFPNICTLLWEINGSLLFSWQAQAKLCPFQDSRILLLFLFVALGR